MKREKRVLKLQKYELEKKYRSKKTTENNHYHHYLGLSKSTKERILDR